LRFTLAKDCGSTSNKEYIHIGPPDMGTLSPGIGLSTECVYYVPISYGLLEQWAYSGFKGIVVISSYI